MWRQGCKITSISVERSRYIRPVYSKVCRFCLNKQGHIFTWLQSIWCPLVVEISPALSSVRRHASEVKRAMMSRESAFVTIFLGNIDLPISATRDQCRAYCRVTKQISKLLHVWNWERICDRQCVQLAVVDVKARSSVLLRDEDNWWDPPCVARIDKVHGYHWIYFLLSEFSHPRPWAIWSWVNWSDIRVFQLDSGLHHIIRTKVTVSYAFELCRCLY